jgi:hypothetical protein
MKEQYKQYAENNPVGIKQKIESATKNYEKYSLPEFKPAFKGYYRKQPAKEGEYDITLPPTENRLKYKPVKRLGY